MGLRLMTLRSRVTGPTDRANQAPQKWPLCSEGFSGIWYIFSTAPPASGSGPQPRSRACLRPSPWPPPTPSLCPWIPSGVPVIATEPCHALLALGSVQGAQRVRGSSRPATRQDPAALIYSFLRPSVVPGTGLSWSPGGHWGCRHGSTLTQPCEEGGAAPVWAGTLRPREGRV